MKNIFIALTILLIGCNSKNENIIEASGIIEGTEIKVSSKVSGTLSKVYFEEGSTVTKNDTIAEVDKTILELQLKQAMAGVELAQSQFDMLVKGARSEDISQAEQVLKQALANLKISKTDYERMISLISNKSVTKKQFDETESRFKISDAQAKSAELALKKIKNISRPEEIRSAKARLIQAEANSELIKQQISDATIKAPNSGVITEIPFQEGELIMQGSTVSTIINLDELYLKLYIQEVNLGKIKYGGKVEIFVDSYPEKALEGKVTFISPSAEFTPKNIQTKEDRAKLVYAIKVTIKNINNILKSGMPADAKIYVEIK